MISDDLLDKLIESIRDTYGYDFQNYSRNYFERRIRQLMKNTGKKEFDDFLHSIVTDVEYFRGLIEKLSINVTSMFRNPGLFWYLRKKVLPILATYPHIRIWSAGTASGEEAWSLAILLREENLYHRSLIYATDFNPIILKQAAKGIIPLHKMARYTGNYIKTGGKEEFSIYYRTTRNNAFLDKSLAKNIVFSTHDLIKGGIFNEFHLILCRNVLIYFNEILTDNVLKLMSHSLVERGYLCLGDKESILFRGPGCCFEEIIREFRVYRKI
ncbi:CheR family methyltransferase [Desulfobacterales bacterium HSG17]|nr:CheR family methyltransferase [Desulfobacterales bacterium HSG17]